MVKRLIEGAGGRAWTYREGKERALFVVEFASSFVKAHHVVTRSDSVSYARGFFDAEGGVPADPQDPPYIYFAQKNRKDLEELWGLLRLLGISCGRIHQPSVRADPDYWRFYVSHSSHIRFARLVGSWHPRKMRILEQMTR